MPFIMPDIAVSNPLVEGEASEVAIFMPVIEPDPPLVNCETAIAPMTATLTSTAIIFEFLFMIFLRLNIVSYN